MVSALRDKLKEKNLLHIADLMGKQQQMSLKELALCSPDELKELGALLDGNHGLNESDIPLFVNTVSAPAIRTSVGYVALLRTTIEAKGLSHIQGILEKQQQPLTLPDLMKMSREQIKQALSTIVVDKETIRQ